MTCGCTENKDLNKNKNLNQYKLSLESMQTLSIDEITNLYRQGYKLEESSRYVSQDIFGLQTAISGNIQSLATNAHPNIKEATARYNGTLTIPMILYGNSGSYGYVHLGAYKPTNALISEIKKCANVMTTLWELAIFPAVSGLIYDITFKAKACRTDKVETCTTCTGENEVSSWTSGVYAGANNTTAPAAPTGLIVTPGNSSLILSWNFVGDPLDPVNKEVFAYKVTVNPGGITGYRGVGTSGRTVTIPGLTNGTSYTVSVKSLSHNNVESSGTATGSGTPTVPCADLTMSSVSCPSSPITQGSSGSVSAFLSAGGTGTLTYKLYVDNNLVDTYYTLELFHAFTHTFNETIAAHTYRVDVTDSCTIPKFATGSCTATIQAALGTITFNVTSAGLPLSGAAISVDDTPRGMTDVYGTFPVPNLTIGSNHTYIVTKSGYNTVGSSIVLSTTAITIPISMTLTPPPTAISMSPNKTSCAPPCDVSVNITWRNNATTDTIFVPSMKVDNVTISPVPYPSQTLGPTQSVMKTFTVLGLTTGDHTMCPDPN